ncbi:MAG TPA: hypothetical protein VKA70_07590, partial [Blastocatellia bacterium]|nr:hypothetical protein [Blastocatellia bacterium]
MSKTVEIDDDIYEFIVSNAQGLGQTVSTVLRRFLPLASPKGPRTGVQSVILKSPRAAATESSLMRIVADPAFRQKTVTD